MFDAAHELELVPECANVDFFRLFAPKKKTLRSTTPYITIDSSFISRKPTYIEKVIFVFFILIHQNVLCILTDVYQT